MGSAIQYKPTKYDAFITVAQDGSGDFNGTTLDVIKDAVDSIASTGGTILIKKGTYTGDVEIALYDNITIKGEGKGNTILETDATTNINLFTAAKKSFIEISDMTIYANRSSSDSNGCALQTTYSGADSTDMANWCKNITLRNLQIKSTGNVSLNWHFGFQLHYVQYANIEFCDIEGVDYGTEFERAQDCKITNCNIKAMDYGVMGSTSTLQRLIIANNNIYPYDNTSLGQGIRIEGGQNIIIEGNTIWNAQGYGAITLTASGSSEVNKSIVNANTMYDCKRMLEIASDSDEIIVSNNHGHNCTYGINIISTPASSYYSDKIIIIGNYINSIYYSAVDIKAGCKNILINGNFFELPDDSAGSGVAAVISTQDAVENVTITNNQFRGVLKRSGANHAVIKLNGASNKNIIIKGNIAECCDALTTYSWLFLWQRYSSEYVTNLIVEGNMQIQYVPTSDTDNGYKQGISLYNIENAIINNNILFAGSVGCVQIQGSNNKSIISNNIDAENGTPTNASKYVLLGSLIGADMNSTSDQAIYLNASKYVIRKIVVTNASTSLTTAVGGIYTAASKGGTDIVAASQVYTALTSSSKFLDLTLEAEAGTDIFTQMPLYLSLTTPQGAAATADIHIYGELLDN